MLSMSDKKTKIIVAVVVCVLIVAAVTAVVLDQVIFKVNKPEPVPEKYAKDWTEDTVFDVGECASVVIPEGEDAKILQLTDIHYDMNNNKKEQTLELVASVIEQSKPHLIALTGDWTSQRTDTLAHAKQVFDLIDSYNIPWAPVFGNHDMEGDLSRYDYADLFAGYKNCLFRVGYTNIGGVGNYIVNLFSSSKDGQYIGSVFMLDSNTSVRLSIQKYIGLSRQQVEWYKWAVQGLTKQFSADGSPVDSVMYMHVPLPEYAQVDPDNLVTGENGEGVWGPEENTGMFDAITSMKSTKAVFCGHDHMNNAVYDKNGVLLGYGVQSGWCKNYGEQSAKGGTLLTIGKDFEINVKQTRYYFAD